MNKRRQRTEALRQATARRRMAEECDNAIEQHRFNKLIEQGVIVFILGSSSLIS
jgi:hypothetical protein